MHEFSVCILSLNTVVYVYPVSEVYFVCSVMFCIMMETVTFHVA